jgi:hypothetical protein
MRLPLLFSVIFLIACRDSPVEPNTDVGLRVWATVSPRSISLRDTTIGLRIRVYVENPTDDEIRVVSGGPPYVFTSDPAKSKGLWGSYRVMNPDGTMRGGPASDWWGQPEYVYKARRAEFQETLLPMKSWIRSDLQPGTYTIRAWFNAREGRSAEFTVRP